MARSTAPLRVVRTAARDQRDPDEELASLFAEEAQLLANLRSVRDRFPAVRQRYAAKHGLTIMLPGIETLRKLFT